MYYDEYLTCLAKTEPPLTLFEHSSDVLQVVNYLIEQNPKTVNLPDTMRAGALLHDVGKIKGDRQSRQWIHAPYSSVYLGPLLDDPRFQSLLSEAGIDVASLDRELLLMICEEHHNPSPKLLRRYKEALLISGADALASSIGSGTVGSVVEIMRSNPYMQVNLELIRSLGFNKGWDNELHHIDLPGQFTEDLFLANMIFRVLDRPLREQGISPILQKGASLWVVGESTAIRTALNNFKVNPKSLYNAVFEKNIYDSILSQFPPGGIQIDILRPLLIDETIAHNTIIALYTRPSSRKLFDRHNLTYLADRADELFTGGLLQGINALWVPVRLKLLELAPDLDLPISVTDTIDKAAKDGKIRRGQALFIKPKQKLNESKKVGKTTDRADHNKDVIDYVQSRDKKLSDDIQELLKLFDYSSNAYRSLTNVVLELRRMQMDIGNGSFDLPMAEVSILDGFPLLVKKPTTNSDLCPICRRFAQAMKATALITGRSEGDSKYFEFKKREGAIKVCRWCFLTGYMDLPISHFVKGRNDISKERGYLILTSPQPRDKLQWLVDFVRRGRTQTTDIEQGGDEEKTKLNHEEVAQLEAMMGAAGGYDKLAVLGLSHRRLSNLKGFVLPTTNVIANLVGIRIPFELLVGEDKVSGAVRHKLVKATMYDLHQVTSAPSMHYNVVTHSAFSVDGRPITLKEMRRANIAYQIADKGNFCRHFNQKKRIWQLDSGLYMLLLSDPRTAASLALRKLHRDKRAPGEQRIQEVIELVESIAENDRWKFDIGQRITATLIDIDLLPKARSFWKTPQEQFSGVELTKWLQRLKMAHDETGVRQWGNQLINALKAGRVASREFKEAHGIEIRPPSEQTVGKILALVDDIIAACAAHRCKLSEFSRDIAEMDYYLLFYHNQKAKEAKQ